MNLRDSRAHVYCDQTGQIKNCTALEKLVIRNAAEPGIQITIDF